MGQNKITPAVKQYPLIALALMLGLGVLAARTQASPTIKEPPPELKEKQTIGSLTEYFQNFVYFYSQVYGSRQKTRVVVPFNMDTHPQFLWVGYQKVNKSGVAVYLVFHPQLKDLKWNKTSSGYINLYQRTKTYADIDSFVKKPPALTKIAVDPNLKLIYQNLNDAIDIDNENFDINQVDYLLTTFVNSPTQDNITYYENIIDASDAQLNDNREIEWFIRAPKAGKDNPILLGTIHIGYL
jgi:hypothetical protein